MEKTNTGRPNIIFILSDQHNPFVAGFAGDTFVNTPNLDKIASKGINFTNCYCNSPLCVPSRASLLTGRLPTATGVYNNLQCLRSDEPTFVSCLAIGGYETVLAGRMHFTCYDQRHGFEKRLVGDISPAFPRPSRQASLYGPLKGTPDQSYVSIQRSGAGQSAMTCFDRAVTDAACNYIRERNDERPLFMTVGYGNPHCPFIAPEEYYKKYFDRLPELDPPHEEEYSNLHPAIRNFIDIRGIRSITKEELKRVRAAYYGNIEYMDSLIGELYRCAAENFGETSVVFIYASDHGEAAGAHGLFWKSNFYEESVKIPFLVSCPDRFISGIKTSMLTSLIDLAPTLLEIGESPGLPQMDGESFISLLYGKNTPGDKSVISMLIDIKGDKPSAMIRKDNFKLIKHCGYSLVQLFDLKSDPNENNNMGENQEYSHIQDMLLSELFLHWDEKDAEKELAIHIHKAELLKKWTATVKPDCYDEWQCPVESNYLLGETEKN
jgi:choline-sulfatase